MPSVQDVATKSVVNPEIHGQGSADVYRERPSSEMSGWGDESKKRTFNWPGRRYIKLEEKQRKSGKLSIIGEAVYLMSEYPMLP